MTTKRKRIWGWYAFDWASQPYHTLIVTFVFGPFFAEIATAHFLGTGLGEEAAKTQAQAIWARCLTYVGLLIGFTAPVMGAMADTTGRRIPWIAMFSIIYVTAAWCLWGVNPDGSNLTYALAMFGIGFVAAEWAYIFTNSQLPSLGNDAEVGQISGTGAALGYAGGVVSLILVLPFLVESAAGVTLIGIEPAFGLLDGTAREGTRAIGPFTALWFIVFIVPYFMWMRDTPIPGSKLQVSKALRSFGQSIAGLRSRPSLAAYLVSSMFFRDAMAGLYTFGGIYANLVLDWPVVYVGIFGIVAAISASIITSIGGGYDRRFGPKPVLVVSIAGLMLVCGVVVSMSREGLFGMPLPEGSFIPDAIFFGCGIVIGGLGGTLQAASRSMMNRHTTEEDATKSFGLFGFFGRATSFLAPALIGAVTLWTESPRLGISPLIVLFAIGLVLLFWVKPNGERAQTWGTSDT
ncbi:MFS transporter [Actibacterium mucosum KCTC 23349]|uniref:MFS transporter n=1 Tax=Actibacterium mucosum KCTC 23349 TaxID=1454373 RepID=A0A037ZPB1_9RHOB|nr:MFS transporter [Actibacterium mucosum]KAJ57388.1 MFS transporter [Actibacterium mucosum KCTC 23349]